MQCDEDTGNQELVDVLQFQGDLIGNLEHEKARMMADGQHPNNNEQLLMVKGHINNCKMA